MNQHLPLSVTTTPLANQSLSLHHTQSFNPTLSLSTPKTHPTFSLLKCSAATSGPENRAATSEIDMQKNPNGIYTQTRDKVVILWDLDNKPPRGPPYDAAMALKKVAEYFGVVIEISAYANRHAFTHLPQWVVEERRERKRLDVLERKGFVVPDELYVCGVCGRKCKTNMDLKKHFKQLHERERQKKLNRMKQLKGKKRQRFKERFVTGNEKYNEAARSLIRPRVGYRLAGELRRAGVHVRTVEDKPQAADWALKRQMQHSMSRGIDWLFLVSDDSDFSDMLRKAGDANLGTVVVGDFDRALGRYADLWVPWNEVENGVVRENDVLPVIRRRGETFDRDQGFFTLSDCDGDIDGECESESDLAGVVDELVSMSSGFDGLRLSSFSEGEEEGFVTEDLDGDYYMSDDDDDVYV